MGDDVLVIEQARASATMIFTRLNQNNLVGLCSKIDTLLKINVIFFFPWKISYPLNTYWVPVLWAAISSCYPQGTRTEDEPSLDRHLWGPPDQVWSTRRSPLGVDLNEDRRSLSCPLTWIATSCCASVCCKMTQWEITLTHYPLGDLNEN